MPSPAVTITGNLKDLTGAANVGSVQIELVNYGSNVPRVSGTGILAQVLTTAVANGSGVFTATIWGNDVITPSSTYYTVTFLSASGGQVASIAYLFTGSGTFDLSTVQPYIPVPVPPVSANAVITNPTGVQTIAGFGLNVPSLGLGLTNITSLATAARTLVLPDANGVVPQSFTPVSHQFLTGLNSSGVLSAAQPAFSDISGTVSASQLPTPTSTTLGGVKSLAAVSHNFLTSIGTDGTPVAAQPAAADLSNGVTGSGAVVLAGSPTITGTATFANVTLGTANTLTTNNIQQGSGASFALLDPLGVSHFFISSSAPYTNTFVNGNGSGVVFLGAAAKTNVSDTTGNITMSGSTSGTTVIQASATASGTLTLPAATDTLVGKATTDILTNKTFDTAGTGNVLKINGSQVTAVTGSTQTVVLSTSPTIFGGILYGGATSGTTKLQAAATASGTLTLPSATDTLVAQATTDTLTNKTISTSGTGNHIRIAAADLPAAVGSANTLLGTTDGTNVTFVTPTRSVLDATAKGWQFLGSATGNTTTIGPVVWSGTFTQLMIMYIIKGYSGGTPVGRLLFGVGSISTTALTNGSNLSEGVTAPTSAASIPGCPLAVTLSNIGRAGTCFVRGASGDLKSYEVIGQNGSPSVSSPPQMFRAAGAFSDLSTNLPLQRAQLTVYDTLTATSASANSFVTGTTIWVWGRNGD